MSRRNPEFDSIHSLGQLIDILKKQDIGFVWQGDNLADAYDYVNLAKAISFAVGFQITADELERKVSDDDEYSVFIACNTGQVGLQYKQIPGQEPEKLYTGSYYWLRKSI